MESIQLVIILEPPETRTVVRGTTPMFIGVGQTNLVCGHCGAVLAKGIVNGQIRNVVYQCRRCTHFCEQVPVPECRIGKAHRIHLTKGTFNFESPMMCPERLVIIGA